MMQNSQWALARVDYYGGIICLERVLPSFDAANTELDKFKQAHLRKFPKDIYYQRLNLSIVKVANYRRR